MTPNQLQISNIVVTSNIKIPINLKKLAEKCPQNVKYKQTRLKAAVMRQSEPVKSSCLIFGNGKMVCTGTNSMDNVRFALNGFVRKIEEALEMSGLNAEEITIQNIVARYAVNHKINLYTFHSFFSEKCVYEPELFPGLSYKFCKGVSAQIFNSGKIVITGPKSFEQLNSVFNEIDRNIALVFE